MEKTRIPTESALAQTAEIHIDQDREAVFNFIASGETLPAWLKKYGPINGATKTVVTKGPYSEIGARRMVYFTDGSTLVEQLLEFEPVAYYSYSVTEITNVLRHLTATGYGQWWFGQAGTTTHVKWVYSFVPKNGLARVLLSVFLSLFYHTFMNQCLQRAKAQLERRAA